MPAPSKPRPKPLIANPVRTAGPQEVYKEMGYDLARVLGWNSAPTDETAGIAVQDAQNICVKILHENHLAGALGHEAPDAESTTLDAEGRSIPGPSRLDVACAHLNIEDKKERAIMLEAMQAAFAQGKGGETDPVPGSNISLSAALQKGG